MTTPSGTELTDEQLNALVMAALGYVWFDPRGIMPYWQFPSDRNKDLVAYSAPKFSTSRDACATFEETITEKVEQSAYAEKVIQAVNEQRHGEHRFIGASDFDRITATPRERCIAFLRMKGVL